jgi:hypothetical protein
VKPVKNSAAVLAAFGAITLAAPVNGAAEPGLAAVPGEISGKSPDGLGTWAVHYQRVSGGNPDVAATISGHMDNEANREVQQATWDGSTRRPWNFDAAGSVSVRPMTVSEVFVSEYNVNEPHMPMKSVATIVCDSRSGELITLDNLFTDKVAGMTRLSEQTEASLAGVAAPDDLRAWKRNGLLAPVTVNFKNWVPTAKGMELHFPDMQFGRGLKAVTVPWSAVSDLIAPEFAPISA